MVTDPNIEVALEVEQEINSQPFTMSHYVQTTTFTHGDGVSSSHAMFWKEMVILTLLYRLQISKNEPLVSYDTQKHLEMDMF